ncbi:MAG: 50S ribosomal protein L27 [Acidaminococcaceae bacterium]|nr:50S ribosomal protein L27 [Acidaminococcaceae bacterium]MBQ7417078.1 50S ribosomal protein L27 [Acidaminococcaceae bacterium]MBQ9256586.1 50S ribosomal protein L27 [Acidaminococcaceae bacterium]
MQRPFRFGRGVCVIVGQQGTRFHVSNNTGMGRDYTIYVKVAVN